MTVFSLSQLNLSRLWGALEGEASFEKGEKLAIKFDVEDSLSKAKEKFAEEYVGVMKRSLASFLTNVRQFRS